MQPIEMIYIYLHYCTLDREMMEYWNDGIMVKKV